MQNDKNSTIKPKYMHKDYHGKELWISLNMLKAKKIQLWKIVILSFNKNIIGSYEFGRSE